MSLTLGCGHESSTAVCPTIMPVQLMGREYTMAWSCFDLRGFLQNWVKIRVVRAHGWSPQCFPLIQMHWTDNITICAVSRAKLDSSGLPSSTHPAPALRSCSHFWDKVQVSMGFLRRWYCKDEKKLAKRFLAQVSQWEDQTDYTNQWSAQVTSSRDQFSEVTNTEFGSTYKYLDRSTCHLRTL